MFGHWGVVDRWRSDGRVSEEELSDERVMEMRWKLVREVEK